MTNLNIFLIQIKQKESVYYSEKRWNILGDSTEVWTISCFINRVI